MTVNTSDKIDFNSNLYLFSQHAGEGVVSKIFTSNPKNLGNTPILITDNERLHMTFDGQYFSADIKQSISQYKIYYKDTDKYENDGNFINLDMHSVSRIVMINDLINNKKPLQKDISKGAAEGRLITEIDNIPKNEPVILLMDNAGEGDELIELPENVLAVIASDGKIDYLSHIASLSRNYFNLFTILFDEEKYAKLKSLKGNYVYISNLNDDLIFNKIDTLSAVSKCQKIIIPKFTDITSFLNYDELNINNAGTKACRVAQIKALAQAEILKDINVPKGFVIPSGYIQKIESFLNSTDDIFERDEMLVNNDFNAELARKCHEIGIDPSLSILRSAFNAEDLYEYPTAGLYASDCCFDKSEFVMVIDHIYHSKDCSKAIESRKRYGIPDSAVQLSVLVQEFVSSEYTFTVYTDLINKRVLIEIGATDFSHLNLGPAVIIYNDVDEKFTVKRSQIYNNKFLIDGNFNIIEKEYGQNIIEENKDKLLPLLKKVAKNALTLEKMLGKPQDIEGGINHGKIYFWQTRDITENALKRL